MRSGKNPFLAGWQILLTLLLLGNMVIAQEEFQCFLKSTGMHTKGISDMDSDAEGKWILSAGHDNTAKLWAAADGKLIRTFYTGETYSGIQRCAISPDGSTVVTGSLNFEAFDASTGQRIMRTGKFENVVKAMRFSKDGKFLAIIIKNTAINIYETATWALYTRIVTENAEFISLDFDGAGWLAVATKNELLFFDPAFNLNKSIEFTEKKHPASIVISPDGSTIAVGFFSQELPEVYDAGSLELLFRPELSASVPVSGSFSHVAYSKSGRYLYAAGNTRIHAPNDQTGALRINSLRNNLVICRWGRMGKGDFGAIPVSGNSVSAMLTLPGGALVFCNDENELTGIGPTGEVLFQLGSKANQFSEYRSEKLKVNTNADEIIIYYQDRQPLVFSLKGRKLEHFSGDELPKRFRPSQHVTPNIRLENLHDSLPVLLNGKSISWLEPEEEILCADIADHGLRFVLGSYNTIYCSGREGDLMWKVNAHGPVRYLNISGNARVLVAALDDGSVRWYRMSDGMLLLELCTFDSDNFWALRTSTGYIDFSTGADSLLGILVINNHSARAAFTLLSDVAVNHHRRDVIEQLIIDWDPEKAMARAGVDAIKFRDLHPTGEAPEQSTAIALKLNPLNRYFLIVASFPNHEAAERKLTQLQKQGYRDSRIVEAGGRFRVALNSYTTFKEAAAKRKELEKTFQGIWIYDSGENPG